MRGRINYGDSVNGSLQGNSDHWIFSANSGDVITINMTSNDFDTYLELRNNSDTIVRQDDDGGDGYNSLIRNYSINTSGTYTIVARGYSSDASGSYSLSLTADTTSSQPNPPAPSNPPSAVENGGGTISYGQTVSGVLSGNRDLWVFNASAGDEVSISMTAGFDTFLELRDSNGTIITQDDDGGTERNSLISNYSINTSGSYTIVARGYSSNPQGSYSLTLAGSSPSNAPEPVNPPPVENGGGTISYGQMVSGVLSGNRDLWVFNASAGDEVSISMTAGFDTYLELRNSNGTIVRQDDDGG